MEKKKGVEGFEDKKKMFVFFLLFFPSLIIALIPDLGLFYNLILKGLLLFFQIIVIKNFVDSYYGE